MPIKPDFFGAAKLSIWRDKNENTIPRRTILRRKYMSAINRKYAANITGFLSIEDGKIMVDVDDFPDPVDLAGFIGDFNGKNTKISVSFAEDITADGVKTVSDE